MRSVRSKLSVLAFCLTAALAGGCGGTGSASLSPLAPSPTGSSGATISGSVNSTSVAPLAAGSFGMMEARTVTITVVGTGLSTTADSQGQFTLTNVPAGNVVLNFSGSGVNATITISGVGPNDQVSIAVTLTGASARVDSERHSAPDNKGELSGRIASIDATARSLRVGDTTVKVPATVTIRHGSQTLQFTDLKVGDKVEVRGTKDATAATPTITATEIKMENGNDGDDDDDKSKSELEGTVSLQAGTCPAITFTVQGTKVTAAAATSYEHGACAAVVNGARVEVKGTRQTDGSVLATRISIEGAPSTSTIVELEGAVSLQTGTCPAITFTVQATKVTAAAATTYEHGACAAVLNGARVTVKGTRQTDGSVLATRISVADVPSTSTTVELKGAVSLQAGTCPAITFTVQATKVTAAAATTYEHGACAAVKNGTRVEVRGTKQTDGSVLATRISFDD